MLRGCAAIAVLLEHWRNLIFVDYSQIVHNRIWVTPIYLLAKGGHQAVIAFFVLSGYFVGGSVLRAIKAACWSWSDYALNRVVRLCLVLWPALLLCFACDHLGLALGHSPLLYSGQGNNHIVGDVSTRLGFSILASNAFFLQTILTPTFGSDGGLWSLAYEFWYYVLFPLGALLWFKSGSSASRLLWWCSAFAVLGLTWGPILIYFPIWLSGVYLYQCKVSIIGAKWRNSILTLSTLLYVAAFYGCSIATQLPALAIDYLLAAVTLAYLRVLLSDLASADTSQPYAKAARELSRFSYTLYVVNIPSLALLTSLFIGDQRLDPTAAHLLGGLAMLALVLLYARSVAALTEDQTDRVRRALKFGSSSK